MRSKFDRAYILYRLRLLSKREAKFIILWVCLVLLTTLLYLGPRYTQTVWDSISSALSSGISFDGYAPAIHEIIPERVERWLKPSEYDEEARTFSYNWTSADMFLPPDLRQQHNIKPSEIPGSVYSLPKVQHSNRRVPEVQPPKADRVVNVMRQLADDEMSQTWLRNPQKSEPHRFPLSREAIDNAIKADGECVLVQIIKGKMYVLSPNDDRHQLHVYYEERRMETIRWLRTLLKLQATDGTSKLPPASPMGANTQKQFPWSRQLRDDLRKRMSVDPQFWLTDNEFALCVRDYPATQNPYDPVQLFAGEPERAYGNLPSAAFTHISCAHRSGSVGIPMWNVRRLKGFENWARIIDEMTAMASTSLPWDKRENRAIFRGETRRCYASRDDFTVPMTYNPDKDQTLGLDADPVSSLEYTPPRFPPKNEFTPILKPLSSENLKPGAVPVKIGGANTYVETTSKTWKYCGRPRLGHLSTLDDNSPTSDTATFLSKYLATRGKPSTVTRTTPVSSLKSMLDVALGDMPSYMSKAGVSPLEKNFLSMKHWNRYKFMLTAEGDCSWSDRIKNQAFMNVALILPESMCREWYVSLLEPWVHYIPTDYHWNSLHEVLLWAVDPNNQADVQQIIRNMNVWAHAMLSPEANELYMREALNTHAKRLNFPITLRPGAQPVEDYVAGKNGARWLLRRGHHEISAFMKGRPIFWIIFVPCAVTLFIRIIIYLFSRVYGLAGIPAVSYTKVGSTDNALGADESELELVGADSESVWH